MADRLDAKLTAQATRPGLARAIAKLPVRQRDVVLLHAWADLDYEQIAVALGIPVGTVRSRLHRARGALRKASTLDTTANEGDPHRWTS